MIIAAAERRDEGKKYYKHNKTFTVINLFNKFHAEEDAAGYLSTHILISLCLRPLPSRSLFFRESQELEANHMGQ